MSISDALPGLLFGLIVSFSAAADEPIDGNPLIAVPGGPFVFGNDSGNDNERPQRTIEGRAFEMNRTEISNAQYQRFVDATRHRSAFYGGHPLLGLAERPVVGVSWYDADAFCAFYGLMLPTEREYERAARGTDGPPFPWGAALLDATRANRGSDTCCGGDDRDGYMMTAPVDSFAEGASKEGILNLIGNVWEWTRDLYVPYVGKAAADLAGRYRVLRGGAWNSDLSHATSTYRLAYDPDFRFAANGGFRCVRE